jgi:hypothetical protein
MEVPFEGIKAEHIEKYLDSGKDIEWRFDLKKGRLVDTATGETIAKFNEPGDIPSTMCRERRKRWAFVKEAYAADPVRKLDKTFKSLDSRIPSQRRGARDELASAGPSAVKDMMKQLRQKGSSYRVRLGILVGLAKMLRKDKKRAKEISRQLSQDDLDLILASVNDPDRTIRIYGAEFLCDLGDPRSVKPALALAEAKDTTSEGAYLSVLVIKDSLDNLSASRRKEMELRLTQLRKKVGPRTKKAIDDTLRGK